MAKCCSIVGILHIVDIFVAPDCFPSFPNYGGLLIVTLLGCKVILVVIVLVVVIVSVNWHVVFKVRKSWVLEVLV